MKFTAKIPGPLTWLVRIICWCVSLAVMWGLFSFYANMKMVNLVGECLENLRHNPGSTAQTSLEASRELVACLDKQAGFAEKFSYAPARKAIAMLPSIPCRYVGVWTATRNTTVYRITLKDDSQYTAEPLRDATPGAQMSSGSWGAREGVMVWLPDEGRFWPPDVNSITTISDTSFSLSERDGSTTRYDLLERTPSGSCTPD